MKPQFRQYSYFKQKETPRKIESVLAHLPHMCVCVCVCTVMVASCWLGFRDWRIITERGTRDRHNTISYSTVLLHEIPRRAIIYSPLNHSASAYGRSVGARWSLRVGADRESASRGNRWNRVPASCSPERERANARPSSTWGPGKTTRVQRVYTQHDRGSIAIHD